MAQDTKRSPTTREAPTRSYPILYYPVSSWLVRSYRLCGIHVVAEAVNPLGEKVAHPLALEVLGWDEGSLHGTVVCRRGRREGAKRARVFVGGGGVRQGDNAPSCPTCGLSAVPTTAATCSFLAEVKVLGSPVLCLVCSQSCVLCSGCTRRSLCILCIICTTCTTGELASPAALGRSRAPMKTEHYLQ